jgi:hypothetical protein
MLDVPCAWPAAAAAAVLLLGVLTSPLPPFSLRHDGDRSAECGVIGQSNPTTRGEAGT